VGALQLGAATQPRRGSLDPAATAPAAATRPAALPTAGTARTATWEAAAATALHLEVTALHLARREVTVRAVAALPIVDTGRTATLGTTRAAPVEASTTGVLAAAGSSIIHMEATGSRFPWAASSKAERQRKAASTFPES